MNPISINNYGRERYQETVKWAAEYDKREQQKSKHKSRSVSLPRLIFLRLTR